jgi:hypothetical protein
MNKLTYTHFKNVVFTTVAALATILPIAIFIHTYGPAIEGKLFPIVSEFHIDTLIRQSDNTIVLTGTLNKLRDDCPFVGATAYVNDPKVPQILRLASIDFKDTDNKVIARVKGIQTWGPWNIHTVLPNSKHELTILSHHSCHSLYNIPTKLVQVTLP